MSGADAPPAEPAPPRPLWPRLLLAALLVALVAAFYLLDLQHFVWEYFRAHRDQLRNWVNEHLLVALVLYFLLYTAVTALSLPVAAPLTLVGGLLFGRWLGTAVVSAAATYGATLAFLTSRYLFRDLVQRRLGPRLRQLDDGLERDGAYYLLTLRLVPLFPFFLVNLGMGLTKIRLRTFVLVSWLGMLPGTFLYINAGQALGDVDSPGDLLSWPVLLSLALLGAVPLAVRLLLRWRGRTSDAS
jgi:uncharacterized membrane protein YdjX (TVP38/TMEM64 family)